MYRRTFASLYVCLSLELLAGCAAPPAKNSLSVLAATTKPCSVQLYPAWVGTAHDTISTGSFITAGKHARDRKLELRFDRFRYSETPSTWGFGARTIGQSAGRDSVRNVHAYRESLPSDDGIAKAAAVSELTRLLGPPQGFADGWGDENEMHSTVGWAFFTLSNGQSMETVSVSCLVTLRHGQEWHIDSMRITRGVARPANGGSAAG